MFLRVWCFGSHIQQRMVCDHVPTSCLFWSHSGLVILCGFGLSLIRFHNAIRLLLIAIFPLSVSVGFSLLLLVSLLYMMFWLCPNTSVNHSPWWSWPIVLFIVDDYPLKRSILDHYSASWLSPLPSTRNSPDVMPWQPSCRHPVAGLMAILRRPHCAAQRHRGNWGGRAAGEGREAHQKPTNIYRRIVIARWFAAIGKPG